MKNVRCLQSNQIIHSFCGTWSDYWLRRKKLYNATLPGAAYIFPGIGAGQWGKLTQCSTLHFPVKKKKKRSWSDMHRVILTSLSLKTLQDYVILLHSSNVASNKFYEVKTAIADDVIILFGWNSYRYWVSISSLRHHQKVKKKPDMHLCGATMNSFKH